MLYLFEDFSTPPKRKLYFVTKAIVDEVLLWKYGKTEDTFYYIYNASENENIMVPHAVVSYIINYGLCLG